MAIKKYHESRGQSQRKICIIPLSSHGTNPASAVISDMKVVPVGSDKEGDIDIEELREKCIKY